MTSLGKKRERDVGVTEGLPHRSPQVVVSGSGQSQTTRSLLICKGTIRHVLRERELVCRFSR